MDVAPAPHAIALVLGDQLDLDSPVLQACKDVLMVEAADESLRIQSHRARTVLFLSAMRHFADALRQRGFV
ncbi:MAG: cryptochrome/photolyase family protein, partial [Betaproteobacteria bacterium]|nr:cryptochrome/photolyase family protein [Betaproteobacteria bacterium]